MLKMVIFLARDNIDIIAMSLYEKKREYDFGADQRYMG